MNDKEILAQLKIAYEAIIDITGNSDSTQVENIKELEKVEDVLAKKYEEVYQKIKNEDDIALYYEEDLLISDCIHCDFKTATGENDQYLPYMDTLHGMKWWEDYAFLIIF